MTAARVRLARPLLPALVALALVAAAELALVLASAASREPLSPVQYPRPFAVAAAFADHFGAIARAAPQTLLTALIGFVGGLALGIAVACLLWASRLLRIAVAPYLILIPMLPVVAVAPLLTIMVRDAFMARILLAAYVTCFPVIVNTAKGLQALDDGKADLMASYGAGRWQLLRKAAWPAALPYVFAGARIGATWSVIGGIILEFTGASRNGLGVLMLQLSYFGNSADSAYFLWAAALGSALLGLLLSAAVVLCERWALKGRRPS
ncbi:ABC transporter permease [Conexibacter sp. CPCC 206217]|uniref:ABC transporter permease n=1 Tax=Conexibacter sp. CPCC 206217 TaxID=3064574 RepID=UPI0027179444|nr:ABC transporter permease subunit [Conexibacter sp. CPCC 206217]MDO8210163.1 ABC transporter permease subunit [Conexibacter sp. CPCC 206217]